MYIYYIFFSIKYEVSEDWEAEINYEIVLRELLKLVRKYTLTLQLNRCLPVKTVSSTDLTYGKCSYLVSKYVVCD